MGDSMSDFASRKAHLEKLLGRPLTTPQPEPAPVSKPGEGESILDVVARQFPYGQHVVPQSFHARAQRRVAAKNREKPESRNVGYSGQNGVGKGQ